MYSRTVSIASYFMSGISTIARFPSTIVFSAGLLAIIFKIVFELVQNFGFLQNLLTSKKTFLNGNEFSGEAQNHVSHFLEITFFPWTNCGGTGNFDILFK